MKDTGSQARRPEADLDMLDRSDRVGDGIAAAMADPGDKVSHTAEGPGPASSTQPPAADADGAADAPDAGTEPTAAEPTDAEQPTDAGPTDAVPPQKPPRAKAKAADTAAGKKAGTRPKSNPWAAPQPGQQSGRPSTRQRPTTPRDRTPGSGTPRRTDPAQRPPRTTPTGSAAPGAAATPVDPRGRQVAWYAIGSALCLVAGYGLGRYENRVVMTLTGAGCGLLLGLWAVARGTWINAKAGPDSKRGPAALGAIAGGLLVALLSMMLVVTSAIIYPERRAYETCMSGANTLIAQQICTDQYDHSLRERGLPGAASIDP